MVNENCLQDIVNAARSAFIKTRFSTNLLKCLAITVGGSTDPSQNNQLLAALKKAKDLGVPKENIDKALARVFNTKMQVISVLPSIV